MSESSFDLRSLFAEFRVDGICTDIVVHEQGHLHRTYISTWKQDDGTERRYVHQRLNTEVFADVPALMNNIEVVTRHVAAKVSARGDDPRSCLQLVPTRTGQAWLDRDGESWRTYDFVENTKSVNLCDGVEQAREAALAVGRFQSDLADLDPTRLRETIHRFFDSPYRLDQLEAARRADKHGRVVDVTEELRFVDERRDLVFAVANRLDAGSLPTRVVHGDTKLNNLLFDSETAHAVCVVDLDTCMPSYSLYDFGDLVRFTAAMSEEDEYDLDRAGMNLELYHALAEGYRESTASFLTPEEVDLMPLSARLVTLTIGMRFLADHLAGDVYFGIRRENHNLDRARVQFRMVADMEAKADAMIMR